MPKDKLPEDELRNKEGQRPEIKFGERRMPADTTTAPYIEGEDQGFAAIGPR